MYFFFRKKRQAEQNESELCGSRVSTAACSPMNKLPHLDSIPASPKESVVESQNTERTTSLNFSHDTVLVQENTYEISLDIGLLSRQTLNDNERKKVLEEKWKPPKMFKFPKNKQNRRYSEDWEEKFTWLRYSPSKDAAYCAVCFVFSTEQSNPEFVNRPFCDWKNAVGQERGALPRHENSEIHRGALQMAHDFLKVCHGERKPITQYISQAYQDKVERNKKALLAILDVIVSLAKRGIPLRGNWCKEKAEEDGNFNFFVNWKAKDNNDLAVHLKNAPRNARYLSPLVQNQLIECLGNVIREKIVAKVMEAEYFSIMADETCDAGTVEQMAVCVRYIMTTADGTVEIAEDFLGFIELQETNAAAISDALLTNLKKWNLDLSKWRGKGFDGAPVMAGVVNGVSQRIQQALPHAKYFTHCRNHCLHLVVVNSCHQVPIIRNFMTAFKDLSFFMNNSHKRKVILKSVISVKEANNLLSDLELHEENLLTDSNRRQGLPSLCETRWLSRVDSISTLLVKYDQIIAALENIVSASSGSSKSDAESYLKQMSGFGFIMAAVIAQYILAYIRPLSVALQSKQCDLVKAYNECQNLIKVIQEQRDDQTFLRLFSRATTLLKLNFGDEEEPEMPRASSSKKQKHRANAPASCAKDYYKINVYFPFVDHVIAHLKSRFPEELKNALLGFHLLPEHLHSLTDEEENDIMNEFQDDLPSPQSFQQELHRWKQSAATVNPNVDRDLSLLLSTSATKDYYPNVHAILSLLLTLPVGSCSCERSFSALRLLKTWTRTSIQETRLNGLALTYVHRENSLVKDINPVEVLQSWDASMHRKITLAFD